MERVSADSELRSPPPSAARRSMSALSAAAAVPFATTLSAAFVIVTIGGLGSYSGAIIAGLLVGLTTAMTIQFQPEWAGAAMYILMAAILLVRPRGLLGERWERFE